MERLKQLRVLRGMSQDDVGNAIGVSKGAISNYEKGHRTPGTDILQRLAEFFEVSTDYLLGRSDDPAVPDTREEVGVPMRNASRRPQTDKLGAGLALHLLKNASYDDLTEAQKRAVYDFAMSVLDEYGEDKNN